MKRTLKTQLKKQAGAGEHIHERSRLFIKGVNNFNKLWAKEIIVRVNPETDNC